MEERVPLGVVASLLSFPPTTQYSRSMSSTSFSPRLAKRADLPQARSDGTRIASCVGLPLAMNERNATMKRPYILLTTMCISCLLALFGGCSKSTDQGTETRHQSTQQAQANPPVFTNVGFALGLSGAAEPTLAFTEVASPCSLILPDGTRYVGECRHNQPNGRGTMTDPKEIGRASWRE